MLSDEEVVELRSVLWAQSALLQKMRGAVEGAEVALACVEDQAAQVSGLASLMAELEASADLLEAEDLAGFDPDEIPRLYEQRRAAVRRDIEKLGCEDWTAFVANCRLHTLREGLDPLAPYEALLTERDFRRLRDESYGAQFCWDRWDYTFVGAAGVLAALTDFLLVRIPKTMGPQSDFAGQAGTPLTAWLKRYDTSAHGGQGDWIAQWAQLLEERCKTPYDTPRMDGVAGMGGRTHRLQTLGHDPVLGFVFGVFDIMSGGITGFSYDHTTGRHSPFHTERWCNLKPVALTEAFLVQLGHLISDVATPNGLPAPFMTLVQGINAGSFGKKHHTVGELARYMYLNGYDLRHFLVSGITPGVVEIILRAYILIRHYGERGEVKLDLAAHPKYRAMLLAAHSIASAANAGKVAFAHGNPLAINEAEWLAFLRYLLPSVRYWVFDRHRLCLEHMERINEKGWAELLQNADKLLRFASDGEDRVVALGGSPLSRPHGREVPPVDDGAVGPTEHTPEPAKEAKRSSGGRRRLSPLEADAFSSPLDRVALQNLRRLPLLPKVVRKYQEVVHDGMFYVENSAEAVRCGPEQFWTLHGLMLEACEILDVAPPELYLRNSKDYNAYTAGAARPFITLHSALAEDLTDEELLFVIGHELGHIKCEHVQYHMIGELLLQPARAAGSVAVGALPVQGRVLGQALSEIADLGIAAAFSEWMRQSEFSADRAGLLACQDQRVAFSALMKLGCGNSRFSGEMNVDAFLAQARHHAAAAGFNGYAKAARFASGGWHDDHPQIVHRTLHLAEWTESGEYQRLLTRT